MSSEIFHQLKLPPGLSLPDRFTYPFSYSPHPIAILAAEELQEKFLPNLEHLHDFDGTEVSLGKMFGVLVVEDRNNRFGYLAAFSGKLRDSNAVDGFVPSIYNRHSNDGFFIGDEKELDALTAQLIKLEGCDVFVSAKKALEKSRVLKEEELSTLRRGIKDGKSKRKQIRENAKGSLNDAEYILLESKLVKESQDDQFQYKRCAKGWKKNIEAAEKSMAEFENQINALKNQRKKKSAEVQKKLFEQYQFLNADSNAKSLYEIFQEWQSELPPGGAGDCAAPKLLQYAFENGLKPVAMAEFWWGASASGQVRKHKSYYPACRSKCEPILGHMLKGLDVDPNPIHAKSSKSQDIEIVYEDDSVLVIVKPDGLLSIPGKSVRDSVYSRIKTIYPDATGPLVVHRLDLSTSGLMVVTKTEQAHKHIQKQFINRDIKKRYVAVLNGCVTGDGGVISMPLRVDLDNRPQQMVCEEFGKPAETRWQVVSVENGTTRVYFTPITGRTHQLRVHAAHPKGLNCSILGDDLYGLPEDRLHLHAELLEFHHPLSNLTMTFENKAPF